MGGMETCRPFSFQLTVAWVLIGLAGVIANGTSAANDRTPRQSGWAAERGEPRAEAEPGNAFLRDRERGWHWYETPPEPPREPEPPEITEQPGSPAEQKPPAWSVEWLRQQLPIALDRAINEPTKTNLAYHSFLQKMAMERAEVFARRTVEVNNLTPALDPGVTDPFTTFARMQTASIAEQERKKILGRVLDEAGIWYFMSGGCPYCVKMDVVLDGMKTIHPNVAILPISLDGSSTGHPVQANWVRDNGHASALGVTQTPTIYLFRPPGDLEMLSVGLLSVSELESRILKLAHRNGWISQEEADRASNGVMSDVLTAQLMQMDDVDWDDPEAAVAAMNSISRYGAETARIDPETGAIVRSERRDFVTDDGQEKESP